MPYEVRTGRSPASEKQGTVAMEAYLRSIAPDAELIVHRSLTVSSSLPLLVAVLVHKYVRPQVGTSYMQYLAPSVGRLIQKRLAKRRSSPPHMQSASERGV